LPLLKAGKSAILGLKPPESGECRRDEGLFGTSEMEAPKEREPSSTAFGLGPLVAATAAVGDRWFCLRDCRIGTGLRAAFAERSARL
jgi:hypothetical protein